MGNKIITFGYTNNFFLLYRITYEKFITVNTPESKTYLYNH